MENIIDILNRIKKHLKLLDRPVVNLLQEGINVEEIDGFPFRLPVEAVELFKWHNGTKINDGDILDDLHFFPGFYFLSISDALLFYQSLLENPLWEECWFPLFTNGAGDFYPIVCGNDKEVQSEIIGFIRGEAENMIEYDSLTSMLLTLDKCYQEKIFFLEDNYLEMDYDKYERIAKFYNPKAEVWND